EDCVLIDMLMCDQASNTIRRKPLSELQVLVPTNIVQADMESAVADNFAASLARLEQAGVPITTCVLPALDEALALTPKYGTITAPEAWVIHHELLESERADEVDPRVASRIFAGRDMPAAHYIELLQAQARLIANVSEYVGDALIAMPTTVHTAPLRQPLEDDDEAYYRINLLTLRNTMLGNFLDTPGLALPNGFDEKGLPTSILFSAASGRDENLLSYGLTLESVVGVSTD
ncbi:MAG: amidase family protein, partial [Pseudomonadota bacterium]